MSCKMIKTLKCQQLYRRKPARVSKLKGEKPQYEFFPVDNISMNNVLYLKEN